MIAKGKLNKIEDNKPRQICTGECHKNKILTDFYASNNELLFQNGRISICKVCLKKAIYNENKEIDINKFKSVLQQMDLPFIYEVYQRVINGKRDSIGSYFTQINSLPQYSSLRWDDTVLYDSKNENDKNKQLAIIDNNDITLEIDENTVVITEEDENAKKDVLRMLGYDPFAGYSKFDQKFLYGELVPYLDVDTLDDQYKISVIIQLLNSNNQIRKIDLAINNLGSSATLLIANDGKIKSLTSIKSQIAKNVNDSAKENAISVKNRGDKSAGKSTLSSLMKQYRELEFEDAEQDYYDQKKAYGMKLVADISNKSILEQLQLDENDYTDMINTQRQMIQELKSKVQDLEEENRQLYVQLGKSKDGVS